MSRLQKKVVLISGASSGFGAAAAREFARAGCKVVLSARRRERLEALADEIRANGGEALVIPCDVTKQDEIDSLIETTLKTYGRIDILFNNAGFGRLNWLDTLEPENDINRQIDVNLRGAIQLARAVLPHMMQQGSGHIINMSSVAGWIAAPMYSVYAATKFGLRGFTEALRREAAPYGVHVSGIYPGPAHTEFGQHTGNSALKEDLNMPDWLSMSAEHVARATVRLAKYPWLRRLILPWWFHPLLWFNDHFPRLVDFVLIQFTRQQRKSEKTGTR